MGLSRSSAVSLTAHNGVELEAGVTLPVGRYVGTANELSISTLQGPSWAKPVYRIELTVEQLAAMGIAPKAQNLMSIEYDVTKFVRSGALIVEN
jgi:hypothetical protein